MTRSDDDEEIPPVREGEDEKIGVPHRRRLADPEVIYKDLMNANKKLWKRLFNCKDIPGPNTDIESFLNTAPTKDYWLRLLKGLDPMERKALINQVVCMHKAYVGFLIHARLQEWRNNNDGYFIR